MKIFLTGISGRLGRAIASLAASRGHEIVGIGRRGWTQPEPLPRNVTALAADSSDLAEVEKLMTGCDAFIHTAGLHSSHLKTHALADYLDVNVTQVGTLITIAHRLGIRRIALSSTLQVHCGIHCAASGSMIIDESLPVRPDTPYTISKCLMETLGRELARILGLSLVSLRLGAFGYIEDAELGLKLLTLSITPEDAARAVLLSVEKDGFRGEPIIIGPSGPFSQADVEKAGEHPRDVLEKHYPGASGILEKEGIVLSTADFQPVISNRRARILLGWEPEFTFSDWLRLKGWKPPG